MNLKLVVASMSLLNLVSCPVFADTQAKKHHHMMKHHMMKHHKRQVADYKDMGSLPVQPAPVEACMISQASMVLATTNQNLDRIANPCNLGWANRLQFSGGVNVDVGKFGNRNGNFMGVNTQRLSLNDAHLDLTATVNEWVRAFASISYNTATINNPNAGQPAAAHVAEYSAAYSNNVSNGATNTLQLEQAYLTVANFDSSPFYAQVGKMFANYGSYTLHPVTRSIDQVFSETLATSLKVGFIANGFNGSIAAFDNPTAKVGQTKRPTDYVAALGYAQPGDQMGWGLGVGYIYDMNGVDDVAYNVNQFTGGGFNTRVGAVALHGDVNSGPFTLGARYVSALQRFNPLDLPKNGVADTGAGGAVNADASGAKPWAAGITAGLSFDPLFGCHRNNVYVGAQFSRDAGGLQVPRSRYLVGYDVDLWKSAKVGIEWDHDTAYSVVRGGSGNNTNLVSLRTSVQFG